jgi:predicted metal-dependent phosphoesterase TrpH
MSMFATRLALLLAAVVFGLVLPCEADDAVPADPAPRWWKGNLHTHSLWSDGDDFPEMIAERYRVRDYHFLALTDHNVLAQGIRWMKAADIAKRGGDEVIPKYQARYGKNWVEIRGEGEAREVRLKPFDEYRSLLEERGKFLMIPAEEISDRAEGVPVHMNASNLRDVIQPLGGATVREAIENNLRQVEEQAEKAGREILAHLNHPNFGWAITAEDIAHAVTERFFEVYNGHPGVNQPGDEHRPSIDRLWDIANTIRLAHLDAPPLYGVATDDSHHYHDKENGSRPFRGWQMVRATHLTPEHIIRAIKAGDSYASSGVTLSDVRYDSQSKTLELSIQPDGDATFTTQFVGTLRGFDDATQPTLDKEGKPPVDKAGKPLRVSRKYSKDVGQVLATAEGLTAKYTLTGKELYVRAIVTSSKPPADPSFAGQKQQAWTQPVGWEWVLAKPAASP